MSVVIAIEELDGIVPVKPVPKRVKKYLDLQGLIEPLYLNAAMEMTANVWHIDYLNAAREAGWDTVIVTWPGDC